MAPDEPGQRPSVVTGGAADRGALQQNMLPERGGISIDASASVNKLH